MQTGMSRPIWLRLTLQHQLGALEVELPWPARVHGKMVNRCWVVPLEGAVVRDLLCAVWHASDPGTMPNQQLYALLDRKEMQPDSSLLELEAGVKV